MDLQKKRAELHANLEHLIGQINRTNGAIALLDELIAEAAAVVQEPVTFGGIDRTSNPTWRNEVLPSSSEEPDWVQQPVKEMLPVQEPVQFDDEERAL